MAKQVETIWDYLDTLGIPNEPRPEKRTVQLALDKGDMNPTQKSRMPDYFMTFEKLDGVYSFVTVLWVDGHWESRHWGRSGKAQSGCEGLDFVMTTTMNLRDPNGDTYGPMVLISEITSEAPQAVLSGYLNPNRVNAAEVMPGLQDNFHDMVGLAGFIEGEEPVSAFMRYNFLKEIIANPVPYYYLNMEDSLILAENLFKRGKEGIICRDDNAYWKAGARDERQFKVKEQIEYDCEVIGICSGKEGSKYENCTGKLLVAFRAFGKPDGDLIILPVGSGLTDSQRHEFYQMPSLVLGSIWKVKGKSFTAYGNLREPVLVEERTDKDTPDFQINKGQWTTRVRNKAVWGYYECK